MELADYRERGVNLADDLPADEGELQINVEHLRREKMSALSLW